MDQRWLQILEHLAAAEALAIDIERSFPPGTKMSEHVAGKMVRQTLNETSGHISRLANQIQRINTVDVTGGERPDALQLPE